MIYLDNNATTALDPQVREVMLAFLTHNYGNPSSMHRFGQEARQAVEMARHQVAALLGCDVRELIFTSGGTESDNAALHGVLATRHTKRAILTSSVEHSAIREPLAGLAKSGYEIIEIPVDASGNLDMNTLAKTLAARSADLALATIMWANNETGVTFDIPAIADLCHHHKVPLHIDAVQAAGKIPINLRSLPVDLLSISAHKFHGPKGAGALFVKRNTRWQPFIRGGPQERDRRGGTENVAGIVGMGAAATLAAKSWDTVAKLRDHFEQQLLKKIPDSHVNGNPMARLPNTTNIAFAGLEAEAILLLLSEHDICASAGAACSSGSLEPSHVLKAMHLADRLAHGSIRFSLSHLTTESEISQTLEILPQIIQRLRATLPV